MAKTKPTPRAANDKALTAVQRELKAVKARVGQLEGEVAGLKDYVHQVPETATPDEDALLGELDEALGNDPVL